jgi:protein-tyrosine kinase
MVLPSLRSKSSLASGEVLPSLRETVETLWTSLVQGSAAGGLERILFASANPGEGTTTIASCAAIGLARDLRQTVALLEANYHRPRLAQYFELPPTPGFADVLRRAAPIEHAQRAPAVPGLALFPAGIAAEISPGELGGDVAAHAMAHVSSAGRFLLIDAPPLLVHAEARLLARFVDVAVLVVRAGETTRSDAEKAKRVLESSGVAILGVVVNRFDPDLPRWIASQGWF